MKSYGALASAGTGIVFSLLAEVFSGAAGATPLGVMSIFNTTVSDVSYNATTNVYTENATTGIPGDPFRQAVLSGPAQPSPRSRSKIMRQAD
jgi:hypothetical protein